MFNKKIRDLILSRFSFITETQADYRYLLMKGEPIDVDVQAIADKLIVKMRKDIYGKKKIITKTIKTKIPETFIDHAKMKLGMKYKSKEIEHKITLDVYALFPEIKGFSKNEVILKAYDRD